MMGRRVTRRPQGQAERAEKAGFLNAAEARVLIRPDPSTTRPQSSGRRLGSFLALNRTAGVAELKIDQCKIKNEYNKNHFNPG